MLSKVKQLLLKFTFDDEMSSIMKRQSMLSKVKQLLLKFAFDDEMSSIMKRQVIKKSFRLFWLHAFLL